jgi:hypothetical protein
MPLEPVHIISKKLFSFQASKFESFRSTFLIQDACVITHCKVKGMKMNQWFCRLGTQYIGDMWCDPDTQGWVPVVRNIDAMRRVFQDEISRQQAHQAADPTEEGGEEDMKDTHESDLVLHQVWWMLLPLLVKKEILNKDFWAPEIDWAAVGDALKNIVREIWQHRDNSLSSILETVRALTSPNTKANPAMVPMLKAYGVSLEDRRVHENLLRDFYVLNQKHEKSNTL